MRSKANIAGHPIHPMLIPFPVAFFVGSLAADIVAKANGMHTWFMIGFVLGIAGWISGLVAAVPGLLDYFGLIPSGTQEKRHATTHMLLNVTIVGCYFVAWLIKIGEAAAPSWGALVLEIIGSCLLLYSGWLGWTLVYEHRLGIDEKAEPTQLRRTA